MGLFKKASMQTAYLKMGIHGGPGSGKSMTACLIAIGLAQHVKAKTGVLPPVFYLDTETGSDWTQDLFEEAGIDLDVAKTRAFINLKSAVTEAQKEQAILIADSATHFWQELTKAAVDSKRKRLRNDYAKLSIEDIGELKSKWAEFTELYINSKCHIIACGRAGSTFEMYEDEEGRKQMLEVGTRMAAEKTFAYEPSLVVEMFSDQMKMSRPKAKDGVKAGGKPQKVVQIRAVVLKDRGRTLNGAEFASPVFKDFLPHIAKLNIGGEHVGVDQEAGSNALFPQSRPAITKHDRKIIVEEIAALLDKHDLSGTGKEAKAQRHALMQKHFGTVAKTEIEEKIPTDDLRRAYDALHRELEGAASRYFPDAPEEIDDAIPEFGGAPSGLEILIGKYAAATDIPALNETQAHAQAYLNDLSEGDREKASAAYSEAVKRLIKTMSGAAVTQDNDEEGAAA